MTTLRVIRRLWDGGHGEVVHLLCAAKEWMAEVKDLIEMLLNMLASPMSAWLPYLDWLSFLILGSLT